MAIGRERMHGWASLAPEQFGIDVVESHLVISRHEGRLEVAEMNALNIFKRIAKRFPASNPQITSLPSGAAMLDFTIGEIRYCVEYLPTYNAFGLSRTAEATPFWDGVEESFVTEEKLEARIVELMKHEGAG